jgi:hypothetical protein
MAIARVRIAKPLAARESAEPALTFTELPRLERDAGEIYDDCNSRFAFEPRPETWERWPA